jgi:RNA polymerase sigma-70 factor (sigma-E family)
MRSKGMHTMTGVPETPDLTSAEMQSAVYDAEFHALFECAYRVAYRILGNRHDADDIANETMAKAWLRWDAISGYGPAWVARCSANAALSQVRRRKLFERLPLVPARPATSSSELREDLVRALRQLSSRQRDVLVLRYVADLAEAEVAAALGCSVGTVKQHAHRGLRALRTNSNLKEI